jgi:hypothetical protein
VFSDINEFYLSCQVIVFFSCGQEVAVICLRSSKTNLNFHVAMCSFFIMNYFKFYILHDCTNFLKTKFEIPVDNLQWVCIHRLQESKIGNFSKTKQTLSSSWKKAEKNSIFLIRMDISCLLLAFEKKRKLKKEKKISVGFLR